MHRNLGAIDDATFLRRITLDLTGRLPTPQLGHEFLKEGKNDRAKLVDALLQSDEFNEFWTFQLSQLLRIRSQPKDTQGALAYHGWLKDQVANGTGYDQIVMQLLTAQGDSHQVGPANFFRTVSGAREQAEFSSEPSIKKISIYRFCTWAYIVELFNTIMV